MQHSLHIFIGDDLAPVAETVNRHLEQHCDREGRTFSHVATWLSEGDCSTVRQIDLHEQKTVIANPTEGIAYFAKKHPKIVVADGSGDVSSDLYVCIYLLLYEKSALEELWKILDWIRASEKHYLVDVYGICEDLAELFCVSEAEKHDLVYQVADMKARVRTACQQLINKERDDYIRHILLIQGCNLNGLGLELDKTNLIRIFGEYARLVSTNFSDIFPIADIDRPDIMSLGISAYWFSPKFLHEYMLSRSFIQMLERERVNQHKMTSPNSLLRLVQDYIDKYSPVLTDGIQNIGLSDKVNELDKFDRQLNTAVNSFLSIMDRTDLSLPEKRAMLALFMGEDDELLDDSVLLKDLPTIDDCMAESLRLFVDGNNKMASDGVEEVLSGPKRDGKVYIPLEDLRKQRTKIRQSQSFIRKSEERLREIEKGISIAEESKKRLTIDGFVYGDSTFKLEHNIVEKPLEETYQPKHEQLPSVDLRKNFSVIRNQGMLGSCTSFAMAAIFEYILNEGRSGKKTCLSPRFLYYNVCEKDSDNTPIDKGSSFYDNIQSLGEKGICEENLCPYDDKFQTAPIEEACDDALTRLVTKALNVEVSHQALTSALSEGYPIGISLKVFDSFARGHKGFIFRPTDKELKSTDFGYHAMVICGYSEKEKVYIVRNSWGEGFGDKGYCYIPFSYIEDKQLCRQACIVTGVSCKEIKETIKDAPRFDIENKDIEYAVLRILIEEEKIQQQTFIDEHNETYRGYMLLLGELSNKGKRDAIMNHSLIRIKPETKTEQVEQEKEVATNKVLFIALPLIIAIICLFALSYSENIIGFCLFAFIAALIWWRYPATKTIKEFQTIALPQVPPDMMKTELQFLFAGCVIDKFYKLRNELSNKRKYLEAYLNNLETWLKEEKVVLSNMDEHMHIPFYSLFSELKADQYLDDHSDDWLDNLWLYKRFNSFELVDESILDFKKQLIADINSKLNAAKSTFSMSDYLLGNAVYDYLPTPNSEKILSTILNMSMPFTQTTAGIPEHRASKILFCNVSPTKRESLENLIQSAYASLPVITSDNSIQKITIIQMQKFKLSETLYGD